LSLSEAKAAVMLNKNIFITTLFFIVAALSANAYTSYVTSSNPAQMIMKSMCSSKIDVARLVPPGGSPHTYEPKPSDMAKISVSTAFIYISDELEPWVAKIEAKNKIALFDLLPDEFKLTFDGEHNHDHGDHEGHDHGEEEITYDPHFWTDPLTLKELLPLLADTLAKLDPDYAGTYANNANIFGKRLVTLHRQLENKLKSVRGKSVMLFHPSFRYMLKRYDIIYRGSVEINPGVEPSPKDIKEILDVMKKYNINAMFIEPQLSKASVENIAEAAGAMIYTLDPVGGVKGRKSYVDLMLYNAKTLNKALK
jgi:zinc transport system substrate-binding protein